MFLLVDALPAALFGALPTGKELETGIAVPDFGSENQP